jgi:hypothetical protein
MSSSPPTPSPDAAGGLTYAEALKRVRPGVLCVLLVLAGVLLSFLVPAIALCGLLTRTGIVWAIVATTLATGASYLALSWHIEQQSAADPKVEQLRLAGLLVVTAAALLAQLALAPGAAGHGTLQLGPSLMVAAAAVIAGVRIMLARARRLTGPGAPSTQRLPGD